jgi:hypothetical protein
MMLSGKAAFTLSERTGSGVISREPKAGSCVDRAEVCCRIR